MIIKWIKFCLLILLPPTLASADTQKIQIPITDEETINAIFQSPIESRKYTEIVYIPGGAMREGGDSVYSRNGDLRFDTNDNIKDISSMGFVVPPPFPLRNTVANYCNGEDAFREGMRIAKLSELHDSGLGCKKISHWLNSNGYKTLRGHKFKNTHVYSTLKNVN